MKYFLPDEFVESIYWIASNAHFHQVLIAAALGFAIGLERVLRGKQASIRTFSMICTGSCLFTILSLEMAAGGNPAADQTRIAAQIVSGVGFIGGGVIFKMQDRIEGITTAALIWLTAGLGMAIGIGKTEIALAAFIVGVAFLLLSVLCYRFLVYFNLSRFAEELDE